MAPQHSRHAALKAEKRELTRSADAEKAAGNSDDLVDAVHVDKVEAGWRDHDLRLVVEDRKRSLVKEEQRDRRGRARFGDGAAPLPVLPHGSKPLGRACAGTDHEAQVLAGAADN